MSRALAVHGAGGGAWEWDIWRRVWGEGLEAIDLEPRADLAATRLADYEAQVLEACRKGAFPTLIGASLGALLAYRIAQGHPVNNLILVNPAIAPTSPTESAAVRRWSQTSALSTHRAFGHGSWYAARHALHRWRDESGRVLSEMSAQSWASASPPGCRVLVMVSESDEDVSPDSMRQWCHQIGAGCHILPGATHLAPLLGEMAASCASLAKAFISQR